MVVSKRPDRLLLPLQLYHSGTAAGYNPVYDLPASPHSKSTKQACGYHPLRKHGRQAANKQTPGRGVRARVRVRDSDTPHSDHTHHGPRHTRHTQSCLHPDDRSYSAFDAGNTPLRAVRGPDDITTNSKHSCSRTQVRTHGSPAQHQSPGNASAVRFGTSGTQSLIPLVLPAAVLRTLVELEVAIAVGRPKPVDNFCE